MLAPQQNSGSPRAHLDDTASAQRSTLRIRNIRESVVYHLLFDGDVGRLTGAQLKTHVQGICSIPVEQQLLTFNGQPINDNSTGYDLNLQDGVMLVLDTVPRAQSNAVPTAEHSAVVRGASADHNTSIAAPPPAAASRSQPQASQPQPSQPRQPQASTSRVDDEIDALRRQEDEILRRQDQLRRDRAAVAYDANHNNANPTFGGAGLYDEVDVDVEVIEEQGKLTWQPTHSADVEEARMLQQDYVWRMEQVRFETERMNREREMRRQQQELEYQAELLDRERVALERKTATERSKFAALQHQRDDDMTIHARAAALRDEASAKYITY